jgi:hypothetical protein
MATNIWLGGTTDWDTGTNWSLGAAPVDTNDVIFDGRTTSDLLLNVDDGDIDLASLHIMESYTGNIGTATVPLEIEISGDLLIEGTGNYYIQSASAGLTTDGSIDRTIINTTGSVFLSSRVNDGSNDTDFVKVIVNSGTVTAYGDTEGDAMGAENGTVIGTLILAPSNGQGSGVTVTVGEECYKNNGSVFTNVIMSGGTLNMHSSMLQCDIFGGSLNHGTTSYTMTANDDTIAALNLYDGTLNWQPSVVATSVRTTSAAAPVITTANVYGGTLDASGMLEKLTTDPTITTMYLHQGATANLDSTYANFIVTTLTKYGGNLLTSSGQALTLS